MDSITWQNRLSFKRGTVNMQLHTCMDRLVCKVIVFWAFQTAKAGGMSGRLFYLCFTQNKVLVDYPVPRVFVTSASDVTTSVTFSLPHMPVPDVTKVISPGEHIHHDFDTELHLRGSSFDFKGIVITSTGDVTVEAGSINEKSSDVFLVQPAAALRREYIVMSYIYQNTSKAPQGPSQLGVVATADQTLVKVTLPSSDVELANDEYGFWVEEGELEMEMNAGETLQLQSLSDLTGTLVTSDRPVAVFAGAMWTSVGVEFMGDHLVEQMPGVVTWGVEFATVPIATKLAGDVFRMLARSNNTHIRVISDVGGTGVMTQLTLEERQYLDTEVASEDQVYIIANKQILVSQFCKSSRSDDARSGDPFMTLVAPVSQWVDSYPFTTILTPFLAEGHFSHYLAITVDRHEISGVRLDGSPIPLELYHRPWSRVSLSPYSSAILRLNGTFAHVLHHAAPHVTLGALLYGLKYQESYGLCLGQSFIESDYRSLCVAVEMGWADWFDNDCDGRMDEEIGNGIDDDGDGYIDEDVYNNIEPRFEPDESMTTYIPLPVPETEKTTTQRNQPTTPTTTTTTARAITTTTASTTTAASTTTTASTTAKATTTKATTSKAPTSKATTYKAQSSSTTKTSSTARSATSKSDNDRVVVQTKVPSAGGAATTTGSDDDGGSGDGQTRSSTSQGQTTTRDPAPFQTAVPHQADTDAGDEDSDEPPSASTPRAGAGGGGPLTTSVRPHVRYNLLADHMEIVIVPMCMLVGAPALCCLYMCCSTCYKARKQGTVDPQAAAKPEPEKRRPRSPPKPRQMNMDLRETGPPVSCKLGVEGKGDRKHKVAVVAPMPRGNKAGATGSSSGGSGNGKGKGVVGKYQVSAE